MEEREILALFWERDEKAIEVSLAKYGGFCRRIAGKILHDHRDEDECVNDALLAAWTTIPPNRPVHLKSYLGTLTRKNAISRLRGRMAQKRGGGELTLVLDELAQITSASSSTEEMVDRHFLTEAINRFVQNLPEGDQNLFMARYWYMTPVKELARQFDRSPNWAAARLFRIRKNLKKELQKENLL